MKEKKVASPKAEIAPIIRYRQSNTYDENGEIITSVLYRPYFENGSDFTLCYMSKMVELALNVKQASIWRVLFYISANQQYGTNGIFGYRCSKKYLQDTLDIKSPTLWSALKYLKENFIVNEMQIDGVFEYMVNPDFITIGKEKNKRIKEWNRRCEIYIKKLEDKSQIVIVD